jgi:hypothetical protein
MRPLLPALLFATSLHAQTWNDFETPPHNYWSVPPQDDVTRLHQRMDKKEITLPAGSDPKVFLAAYLKALHVPVSSQIMVFSKSSLQRTVVSGHNPRALYFNEDTYVGWIPGGLIEVTGIDPVLGGIFYIFKAPDERHPLPTLERRDSCLGCHAGGPTSFLPGLMVRSLHTTEDGRSLGEAGPHNGGHHTPFEKRWGGWYVTGAPDGMQHLANLYSTREDEPVRIAADRILPAGTHLTPGSDVLPMMLHDHQCVAVNAFMEANYRIRTALHAAGGDKPVAERAIPENAKETAETQTEKLVRFLLFADEARLPAPVTGSGAFRTNFASGRKADKQGRSLKDFQLQDRLMRYRCSYMIYSAAFRGLPAAFQKQVFTALREALQGGKAGSHLPAEERQAIHEILSATLTAYQS